MKTQYYVASSLDGYIATPDHSLDWLLQFGDVEETSYPAFIRDVGAIAMGSNTYEWILRHQSDSASPPDSGASGAEVSPEWPYRQPVWVFTTRSLPTIERADIRFVQGDVKPVYQEMVAVSGGKNLWIVGGGGLAGQFYDCGLLDELIVQVTAVTLGRGAPLLPRRVASPPLRLKSVTTFGEGFVEIRYEVPRPA